MKDGKRNGRAATGGIGLAGEAGLCDGGNQPRGWLGDWVPVSRVAVAPIACAANCRHSSTVAVPRRWYGQTDAQPYRHEADGRQEGGTASRETEERPEQQRSPHPGREYLQGYAPVQRCSRLLRQSCAGR